MVAVKVNKVHSYLPLIRSACEQSKSCEYHWPEELSEVLADHFGEGFLHPVGDGAVVHVGVEHGVAVVKQQVLHSHRVALGVGGGVEVEAEREWGRRGLWAGSKLYLRSLADEEGVEVPHSSGLVAGRGHDGTPDLGPRHVSALLAEVMGGERRLRDRRVQHWDEVEVDPLLGEIAHRGEVFVVRRSTGCGQVWAWRPHWSCRVVEGERGVEVVLKKEIHINTFAIQILGKEQT